MSSHNSKQQIKHSKGFTLVEMLIVAPIVILMIGIFISTIVSMTGDVLATRASNSMAYNIQDALNRIQSDVTLSGAFLSTNNLPIGSPQGYNNDTTAFHNANATTGPVLILNSYATTSNPLSSARNLYYMANQPNACNSSQLNSNPPVMLNIIYFVKDNTLWRRTVVPGNYKTVGCVNGSISAPWQKPSCAPTSTGTICDSKDERLVDNVPTDGFSLSYFTTPSTTSANTIATDINQSDSVRLAALQTSSTVSVTINSATTIAGRDVTQTGTIRASSPNNNSTVTADVNWSSFSLASGWSNYGYEYNINGYRRTKNGLITLKGLIKKSSAIVGGETIANLPIGYRPPEQQIFQTSTVNTASRVDVLPNGDVRVISGDAGWVSLENINFLASDSANNFTNFPSIQNNWVYFGNSSTGYPFSQPSYTKDNEGRVHTRGLVKNGVTTNPTAIVTLPADYAPSELQHMASSSNNGFGLIGISASRNVQAKVANSSYLSIAAIFYPISYTGWASLALQGSWLAWGSGCANPQYTKASDGMVTVRGLLKNTTSPASGSIIAYLPPGYRPAQTILNSVSANDVYARVDIRNSGEIIYRAGLTTSWLSIDNIMFYADN